MSVLGIPRNELDANSVSCDAILYVTTKRDANVDWNNHLVRSIAVAVVAEAAFAALFIASTIETIASGIALMIVSSVSFFIPPCSYKAQFSESVREPVKKYSAST